MPDFREAGFDGHFQVSHDALHPCRADRVLEIDAHGRQHVLWPEVHGADGVDAPNGAALGRLSLNQPAHTLHYENAMIELIRSKQAGLPAPKEKPATRPANVVNLMDALRRSIEAGGGKAKPEKAVGKRAAAEPTPAKKRVKKAS